MKKRLSVIMLMLLLVLITGGCQLKNIVIQTPTEPDKPYVLNERQIAILKEAGLPTDYEALTGDQGMAIRYIEKGLQYLENKYGERFVYRGYVPLGLLEKERLIAQLEETALKDPEADIITVYYPTKDNPNYSDNYMTYVVTPIYKARLYDYLDSQLADVPYLLDFIVVDTLYQHPDDVPDDIYAIDGKIGAGVSLFLDGGAMTEAEYDAFIENYKAWSQEHKMRATLEIGLIKPGYVEKMTPEYYYNYVGKEYRLRYDTVHLGRQ